MAKARPIHCSEAAGTRAQMGGWVEGAMERRVGGGWMDGRVGGEALRRRAETAQVS